MAKLELTPGARVQVAENTQGATPPESGWMDVLKLTEYNAERGVEGEEEEFFFGETDPEVSGGSDTAEYSFNGALSWDDAGQNLLRGIYKTRGLCWCRILTDSVLGTGEAQKLRIEGYSFRGERNGQRYQTTGFTGRGVGEIFTLPIT